MLGRAPRENTRARTTLGDEERRLGEWARYQRRFEDQLNAYQRARLDVSPAFDWDPLESVWRTNLAACVTFVKDMGDLPRLNGEDAREFALACLDDASESACVKIGKRACKHRVARVAAQ